MEEFTQETPKLKRKLIYSLLWGMSFIALGAANLYMFDVIFGPKLIALEIMSPREMSDIPEEFTQVSISTRNIKLPIYIVVETPQGTLWIQDKLLPRRFKDNLQGRARLGEGEVGIGEVFRIFVIATEKDLPIGVLERVPSRAIYSNTVNVRRVWIN